MDIDRVVTVATQECLRQNVGIDRVAMLLEAYCLAYEIIDLRLDDIMSLALLVEPTTRGQFRVGAVTFQNGGISTNPASIPEQMVRLFSHLEPGISAYDFVRSFELIHPFSDGNGRLGWIIYNHLRGSMDKPDPLPDFKF